METVHLEHAQIEQIVATVIDVGGAARAMDEAHTVARRAMSHLEGFPPSSSIRALGEICDFVLDRRA
jgi:geranylgeranyl pyrophosphate synthase